jgi:hypothetical protein
MIKIDKGIPMPGHHSEKYPWKDMEVGDSFLVEGMMKATQMSGPKAYAAKKYGHTYATRLEEKGLRVWRIA